MWEGSFLSTHTDKPKVRHTHTLIVGSGIAGATIAQIMLRQGQGSVMIVEAGPNINMQDQRSWYDVALGGLAPYDRHCRDAPEDHEDTGPQSIVFSDSRLFARGGTTLHWTGSCPRLKPEDFAKKTNTGLGMDWPISYEDLEPFYFKAEKVIGVSGDSRRNSCPRKNEYPLPPIDPPLLDRELIRGCESLGWSWEQMPIARITAPYQDRVQCQTTGTCRYCPFGARFSANLLLDQLQLNSRFQYVQGAVREILMSDPRRARGVLVLDPKTGLETIIESERIIICAGAIESAKILMASSSAEWPMGLGGNSGHLGRHLVCHPFPTLWAEIPENSRRLFQEIHFPVWSSRQFDTPQTQRTGKLLMFTPPAGPHLQVANLIASGHDRAEIENRVLGSNRLLLVGLFEMNPGENSFIKLHKGNTRFGIPRTEAHFDWHEESLNACLAYETQFRLLAKSMGLKPLNFSIDQSTDRYMVRADHASGICRMTRDDTSGVVDPDLKVHGTDNVWVCSNAVFPTNGAANPTLTLTALAIRLAEGLSA